jgi:hypothetical protein
LDKLSAHLQQIDESYVQHMKHALSFAFELAVASLVCLVHAFLPFLFEKKGSEQVQRLHERMVINRQNLSEHKVSKRRYRSVTQEAVEQ